MDTRLVKARRLFVFFVMALAACGGVSLLAACTQATATHSAATMHFTPSPTATPAYDTYPIEVAFSAHGPALNSAQRRWILRILHSRSYGGLRRRLRFANMRGYATPVVVYVNRAEGNQVDRGGDVIGERCNVWFDPLLRGLFVGTEVLCSPPTPKPLISY